MNRLTDEQKDILNTFNQSSIVSAGAGSGKTTIMIEKIMEELKAGASLENILALTFTNLAAGEMKQRLSSKLLEFAIESERLDLLEQIDILPQADISTFHSFYEKIVKKYFFVIGISPSFEIIPEQKLLALQELSFAKATEKLKNSSMERYLALLDVLGRRRSAAAIKERIFKLDQYLSSQFDKEKFLNEVAFKMYNNQEEAFSCFFSESYAFATKAKAELEKLLLKAKAFGEDLLCAHINKCISLLEEFVGADYSKSFSLLLGEFKFPELRESKTLPKTETFLKVKDAKAIFGNYLKKFREKNYGSFENVLSSFESCKENIASIVELYRDYKSFLSEEKSKINMFDFSDLEEFCYQILQNQAAREEIRDKYHKIFVDEFQDINPIQNEILNLVSKDNNVFYVGDSKQSIYAFRQADVDIFVDTLKNFEKTEDKRSLKLTYNFRSNPKILNFVNKVFGNLMTEKSAQINYEKEAKFNLENEIIKDSKISCNEPSVKIIGVVEEKEGQVEPSGIYSALSAPKNFSQISNEAKVIASEISKLLREKIIDNSGEAREIQFGDIAILVRKRSDLVLSLSKAFLEANIPFDVSDEIDLLSSKENQLLISLLNLVLNRKNDLVLAPVLSSPFFDFSFDELGEISLEEGEYFYEKFENYLKKDDKLSKKLLAFNKSLDEFSFSIKTDGVRAAVLKFFEKTNYISHVLKSENGFVKLNVIKQFLAHIEQAGFNFDLALLCDYLSKNKQIKVPSVKSSTDNCVKITTIHSSKGLEFPVVILADCGRDLFSNRKDGADLKIDKNFGMALKNYNNLERKVYDSIFEQIIVNSQKRREIAENLRLLYVALTRAKNKLIITGKILEHENLFDSVSEIDCETDLISVKQSYLNLILGSIKGREIDSLEVKIEDGSEQQIEIKTEDKFDFNLLKSAKENLKFVYPNLERTRLSTKTSVSLVAFDGSGYENIVDSPENYQASKHLSFSTVEEGNVVHEIMEKLNFYSENLQQEVLELIKETNNGTFDPKLLFSTIIRNVDIIKQIIPKENKIYKEKEFMIYESPLRVFGRGAEEKILIQGKIDLFSCGIKNILMDYKYTSIVDEERLVKKYSGQLRAYKFALENAINSKVDEVYLLSLKQGKLIRVNI